MKAARGLNALARIGAILMVLSALSIPIIETRASVPEPKKQLMSAAYLMDRGSLTLRDEDAQHLTHLYYAFGLIEDGELTVSHLRQWDKLLRYREKFPHIRLVLAIGGWGADGFSQAVKTEESRARFVNSIVETIRAYDLDGIDLDWEYPTLSTGGIAASDGDRENLVSLVRELRGAMERLEAQTGKRYQLSLAVGASEGILKGIDARALSGLIDCVNVMTYDLRTEKKATHQANLYPAAYDDSQISADTAIRLLQSMGFAREQLVIGGAAYGRIWTGATELGGSTLSKGNKSIAYDKVRSEYMSQDAYTYHWDETAMAPYLLGEQTFISFDDPRSMRLKAEYARDRGLGGMMFWEYTQDSSGDLLRAMSQGLRTD